MTGISSNMIAAIWRGVKVVITTKQLWVQILLVACERFAMVKISNNCPVEYKAKRLLYVIIGQKKFITIITVLLCLVIEVGYFPDSISLDPSKIKGRTELQNTLVLLKVS